MSSPDDLLTRIRGEYSEMPGLRLTLAQACRLWQVDTATCHTVLAALITEGFLTRTVDGAFIALPKPASARAPMLKARQRAKSVANAAVPRSA
jgi:hypothetical protein